MPLSQKEIIQQSQYADAFNRGVKMARSLKPAQTPGVRTAHTQHGVFRIVDKRPGWPTLELDVCMKDGSTKTYLFLAIEKKKKPAITMDSAKISMDDNDIGMDQ